MPGYAAALTSLATVKTELNITATTDDNYLTFLIQVASDHIAGRCNRNFTYSNAWVEQVPSYSQTRIILTHTPVISLTSISYQDGGTVDAAGYSIIDGPKGWIYSSTGWRSAASFYANVAARDIYSGSEANAYTVTYAGGYVTPQQAIDASLVRTLPYDLEHATVLFVVSLYRGRGQDRRVTGESLLSYSSRFQELPELPEVTNVIRRYRRIGVGR